LNIHAIMILVVLGLLLVLFIPFILVHIEARRRKGLSTKRIGPILYRAVYDPRRKKIESRIVIAGYPVLGINKHTHRLAKGKTLRHIHIGPFSISLKGVAYEPIKKDRRKDRAKRRGKKKNN